jgi:hypothetical protein
MKYLIISLLVLLILYGCVSKAEPTLQNIVEEKNELIEIKTLENKSIEAKSANARNITVGMLVDSYSYSPTDQQLMEFFYIANEILKNLTDTEMVLLSIKRYDFTSSAGNHLLGDPLVTLYPANETPEYLIFFKSDKSSASYGGYSMRVERSDVCNRYSLPKTGSQKYMAIGVIDWTHMFASCGYDYSDPQHPVHISDFSVGGECRNTKNTPCAYNEEFGYYQCNREDMLSSLYNSNRYYFSASTAVHELMHNFGGGVYIDHFDTAGCDELMGETSYAEQPGAFEKYAGICPATYNIFEDNYKGCD